MAACEIVASMFGIVRDDASGIAGGRLYIAIDDAAAAEEDTAGEANGRI